ncbi:MAG: poly-gamma-glutamate system protein [Synergistaceae bacterium]|jgi:poly-gamma-glutamate system protein|nr:poly-gamma-glutamate system protein [Synergistaceae bacterium]
MKSVAQNSSLEDEFVSSICYNYRLVFLAVFLALLWFAGGGSLTEEQGRVWDVVRNAQKALWAAQAKTRVPLSPENDPLRTGLIGVEWSPLTTTLGDLGAKRTSCNPLWAVQCLRWFDELGLKKGDRIALYTSSSFPAFALAALAAAEERGLDVLLSVSLGSSMWGANRVEFPWPMMARALREGGFVRTRAAFYTPGGAGDGGRDFSGEIMELLRRLTEEENVPFVVPENLEEAVRFKTERLLGWRPKLFVNIGGGEASLGDSGTLISNGLLLPPKEFFWSGALPGEGGVIAEALKAGIPVLHILGVRKLAEENGIPWDAGVFVKMNPGRRPVWAFAGLILFLAVLYSHRRWLLYT